MLENLLNYSPIVLALIGGTIAFLFSVLGAAIVLLFKKINNNFMDLMIALSAGVMLSAAFFSLLMPAIEMSSTLYTHPIISVTFGFIVGGLIIFISNKLLNKLFCDEKIKISKICALITSITLHNIPEGLVIGVAFGSLFYNNTVTCLVAAISLSLGITLQNFPEGAALSLPLRKSGLSCTKSFLISLFSALVEPISALIGALIVIKVQIVLPLILSFAAGAMIYVTSMELIPECQNNKNNDIITMLIILGFTIMMIMELFFQ